MNLSESYRKRINELAGISLKNKSINVDGLLDLAKGIDYNMFLKKTDLLTSKYNILYRGGDEENMVNQTFMTDYIGHAREYGNKVNGIVYNFNDVLHFNDNTFNSLRAFFFKKSKIDIKKIYLPFFKNHKLFDAMGGEYSNENAVVNFVFNFLNNTTPYSKVQQNKVKNDLLIPIMLYFAISKNKNIISFLGGDYIDYGGADEFVVNDISRYITLKDIWNKANNNKK